MINYMQYAYNAVNAGNITEAIKWFEKAWAENPGNFQALAWLGQCLCNIGQRNQGIIHLRQAGTKLLEASSVNKDISLVLEVAKQLQHWGDLHGAYTLLNGAVNVTKSDFRCFQLLAAACAQLNKKSEAIKAGEQAVCLAPENVMMQVFLATLLADNKSYDAAKTLLEKALGSKPNAREGFRAHKEMARVLDKLGQFDSVFPHLHASAELSNQLPEYTGQDKDLIPELLESNRVGLNREILGRWSEVKFPATQPAPVFLMGFMRSGTTLTQEVLDAHPNVFVSDEAEFVLGLESELNQMDSTDSTTAEKLNKLDFSGVQHLREFYWNTVKGRYGDIIDQRIFVDKFTMNTIDLGIINVIFPDAKVIFVTRDPRDVCLSCFMQLLVPTATTVHLLSWQETANFYAKVMDWWLYIRAQLTLDVIEFCYEDAITEFETTFRRIFAFLDLAWEPDVINFHQNAAEKFIATPSRSQVSQPLYSTSVNRWRHFEQEFAPVAELLKPYITAFGYSP